MVFHSPMGFWRALGGLAERIDGAGAMPVVARRRRSAPRSRCARRTRGRAAARAGG